VKIGHRFGRMRTALISGVNLQKRLVVFDLFAVMGIHCVCYLLVSRHTIERLNHIELAYHEMIVNN
jgi:hypothetical protein